MECRQAVEDFPWMDAKSRIRGSVKEWRAAFPCARAVNVSLRNDIIDSDFVHIRGDARVQRLHTVNMALCHSVTNAAFVYLRGIRTLNMFIDWTSIGWTKMRQGKITDAAFIHLLRGIHTLNMYGCNQQAITDAAFVNLRGIYKRTLLELL